MLFFVNDIDIKMRAEQYVVIMNRKYCCIPVAM